MHIHLDAIGGISGNMFVGAMLDCWPELADSLPEQIMLAGFPELVTLHVETKHDGILGGTYFHVEANTENNHAHRSYSLIKDIIINSDLEESVKTHALGIFLCLAEAESKVHNTSIDDVNFHEVGAWDSIADIIAAAFLISASEVVSWSVSSLPLGNGRVQTEHGVLPVPVPAVTSMLDGYCFHGDDFEGERVTPTGAAILFYLNANKPKPSQSVSIAKSGFGFGTREFKGLSNVLRVMVLDKTLSASPWQEDSVLELVFEVDDQSAEDLAFASETIRQLEGVLDVSLQSLIGKKQRPLISVRVLAKPEFEDELLTACFNETTTLGIRREIINRAILPRIEMSVEIDDEAYAAKIVQRPNGEITVKAEFDDYAPATNSQNERALLKQEIEALAYDALVEQAQENEE